MKTLTIAVFAASLLAGTAAGDVEFNSNWPVRGKRVININTVVRVNQIEVARNANRGRDEARDHSVEAVETFRKAVADAIPEAKVPYEELWTIFSGRYAEHCCETVVPYPDVRGTLDELKARGWLLGVNTNKPRFAVNAILEKFGFARYFGSAIVAGGDGIPLKPDPQSLRECASRLAGHRLSSRDWMVGDSWTDMQAASSAGIKGAFCTYGFGFLRDSRFTVKVNGFGELLRHLKSED